MRAPSFVAATVSRWWLAGHEMEHKLKATAARPERFADLLMLSNEPMFAWRLDGPIEFWNVGAERLYGFPADEAVGAAATRCYEPNFRSNLPSGSNSLKMNGTGRANCITFARMVAK